MNLDTNSFHRRPGASHYELHTVENVILLVTSCSVRKIQHRHTYQYLKFQGILEFIGRQFLASSMISRPLGGKRRAYSVDNAFSESVAT